MRTSCAAFFYSTIFFSGIIATPAPKAARRDTVPILGDLGTIDDWPSLTSALSAIASGIETDAAEASEVASAFQAVFKAIQPTATPTSIPEVTSILSSIYGTATPTNLIENAAELVLNGLKPADFEHNVIGAPNTPENSYNNVNPEEPSIPIYPQKSPDDAPYSVSEDSLRGAIYIPESFEFGSGSKQPVILSPGTGVYGGQNFLPNYAKLLADTSFADPLWLNIPGALLGDAQVNAEYVAYAINYISAVSNNVNVSVITWSQGSLDTQWAFKYWPSTRSVVSDFIGVSPDFHGTVEAYLVCPGFPKVPCDPSILQQAYSSNFINTIRADGGDSAYVPTTTLYSIFDEIVQPQAGTGASAYILDERGVGVSNNEVQTLCPGQPAGAFYTHEAMLFNPVAYALAVDALTHDGPGLSSRIDLATLCQEIATEGLSLADVIATEATIPIAGFNLVAYFPKLFVEPAIMSYAA